MAVLLASDVGGASPARCSTSTAAPRLGEPGSADLPERWLTDWERSERLPFYTRANAGEVLPDPASPLGWTLVFEQGLLPGWLRGLVDFGIYRDGELPIGPPAGRRHCSAATSTSTCPTAG